MARVAQGVAVNRDGSDTAANSRFKYGWVDNTVVGGKTYLALETDATMTQIRDHADEVWYAVFTVPADTTGREVVTLKNVPGRAELKLEKTTETTHYESLLAAPAQLLELQSLPERFTRVVPPDRMKQAVQDWLLGNG